MKQYIENNIHLLEEYCEKEGLSIDKILKSPKSYGIDYMAIQVRNQVPSDKGLNDSTPAKIVLTMRRNEDGILFEPSNDIKNYLA